MSSSRRKNACHGPEMGPSSLKRKHGVKDLCKKSASIDHSVARSGPAPNSHHMKSKSLEKPKKTGTSKRSSKRARTSPEEVLYPLKHPPYHDFASTTGDDLSALEKSRMRNPFPSVLHKILERADEENLEPADSEYSSEPRLRDIVRWKPHGRAFVVLSRGSFEKHILPVYFPYQTEYASFQRQLNLYGFLRLTQKGSTDQNAYYHELFLRSRPDLSRWIRRCKEKVSSVRQTMDPATEPDFDSFPKLIDPFAMKNAQAKKAAKEPKPKIVYAEFQTIECGDLEARAESITSKGDSDVDTIDADASPTLMSALSQFSQGLSTKLKINSAPDLTVPKNIKLLNASISHDIAFAQDQEENTQQLILQQQGHHRELEIRDDSFNRSCIEKGSSTLRTPEPPDSVSRFMPVQTGKPCDSLDLAASTKKEVVSISSKTKAIGSLDVELSKTKLKLQAEEFSQELLALVKREHVGSLGSPGRSRSTSFDVGKAVTDSRCLVSSKCVSRIAENLQQRKRKYTQGSDFKLVLPTASSLSSIAARDVRHLGSWNTDGSGINLDISAAARSVSFQSNFDHENRRLLSSSSSGSFLQAGQQLTTNGETGSSTSSEDDSTRWFGEFSNSLVTRRNDAFIPDDFEFQSE